MSRECHTTRQSSHDRFPSFCELHHAPPSNHLIVNKNNALHYRSPQRTQEKTNDDDDNNNNTTTRPACNGGWSNRALGRCSCGGIVCEEHFRGSRGATGQQQQHRGTVKATSVCQSSPCGCLGRRHEQHWLCFRVSLLSGHYYVRVVPGCKAPQLCPPRRFLGH